MLIIICLEPIIFNKKCFIMYPYRPPNETNKKNDELNETLDKAINKYDNIFRAGNVNIDTGDTWKDTNSYLCDFMETISRSNIFKLQIFLKNRFHPNSRSYLVLTSGQKSKKWSEPFLRKYQSFWFWTNLETFSRISPNQEFFFKNPFLWLFYFYSRLTSCQKSKKSLDPFLSKLPYQPTNQPTLIWRPFREYLQIKNFIQKSGSVDFLPL